MGGGVFTAIHLWNRYMDLCPHMNTYCQNALIAESVCLYFILCNMGLIEKHLRLSIALSVSEDIYWLRVITAAGKSVS